MNLGIADKVAVVTGAAGDIGRTVAQHLVHNGAKVVVSDTDEDALATVAAELAETGRGNVWPYPGDLTRQDECDRLANFAQTHGGVDICVHAAGITGAKGDPLELSDEEYDEAWQIDFMSAVKIARAVTPSMIERSWGRVVFVASENATQSYGDEMPYNVAKAALVNFTKGTAQVYAPRGVLFNVVSPAFIETDMTDQMMEQKAEEEGIGVDEAVEQFLEEERPHLVLGRRGRPEEVAAVIAFLCSDLASFVVGSNYRVDGGSVMAVDM